jgi:cytidylate kinase
MSGPPAVVTISAAHGTRGESVGRRVADSLGLPFLDRAIPAAVARELMAPLADVEYAERHLARGLSHWLDLFAPLGSAWLGVPEPLEPFHSELEYLNHTESVMRRAAQHGVVILGRGASVVLRDDPRALHVRLDGPPERRLALVMAESGMGESEARRSQRETDLVRRHYLRHFYRVDVASPHLYHLYLDATAIPESALADLVVTAARARAAAALHSAT